MSGYRIASSAQADLVDIRRYTLKRWGQVQWTSYFSELRQAMTLLADNPTMGIRTPELNESYYRFPVQHHVIYYIKKTDHIVIAAVLGKSMSPAKHLNGLN